MLNIFYPKIYAKDITTIPYEKLFNKNIRGLIFDIDNTLVPFDVPEATDDIVKFFNNLKEIGFKVCLLSNNNKNRVELFNKKLGLPAVYNAKKPLLKGINKALKLLGVEEQNTAIIGDQVFTDIWCGNRKKMVTILVKPVANRDEFTVKLKRGIESLVIRLYMNKVINNKKKTI